MGIHHGAASAVTVIGDNVASASPSATGSADLVSAATNTGGIIITSVSISIIASGVTGGTVTLDFIVGGNTVMRVRALASGAQGHNAAGGIGAIEISSGQAVGYAFTETDSSIAGSGEIFITWRHK